MDALRLVATARYLHLKSQELHEALMTTHETIGLEVEEKVRLRGAAPASRPPHGPTCDHVLQVPRSPGCYRFQC